MTLSEEIGLGSLVALGTIGSVCTILLRSTHQNLTTLDTMRREASNAAEKLRQELHDHDDTIFKLQNLCADYRYAIAKLEAERDLLQRTNMEYRSQAKQTPKSNEPIRPTQWEARQTSSTPTAENPKFKPNPEDVLD
jgi:peptidoglycan hydrolase CwlO-like protein